MILDFFLIEVFFDVVVCVGDFVIFMVIYDFILLADFDFFWSNGMIGVFIEVNFFIIIIYMFIYGNVVGICMQDYMVFVMLLEFEIMVSINEGQFYFFVN